MTSRALPTPSLGGADGPLTIPPRARILRALGEAREPSGSCRRGVPHGRLDRRAGQWRVRPFRCGHARALEVPLALMAVAFPIVPERPLSGRHHGRAERTTPPGVRRRPTTAGVHERTFLQATRWRPRDRALEGDDPARSFGQMMAAKDAFTTWFLGGSKRSTASTDSAGDRGAVEARRDSEPAG